MFWFRGAIGTPKLSTLTFHVWCRPQSTILRHASCMRTSCSQETPSNCKENVELDAMYRHNRTRCLYKWLYQTPVKKIRPWGWRDCESARCTTLPGQSRCGPERMLSCRTDSRKYLVRRYRCAKRYFQTPSQILEMRGAHSPGAYLPPCQSLVQITVDVYHVLGPSGDWCNIHHINVCIFLSYADTIQFIHARGFEYGFFWRDCIQLIVEKTKDGGYIFLLQTHVSLLHAHKPCHNIYI